jgi:glycosyltransferase involved in cell wall biosynthesis
MKPISWTVVLPTYDRPEMLKRAIESCLTQTEPCEIVVVDDNSGLSTHQVAAQFPQIVYIRNERNLGHCASVNLGVKRARGTWIKHLDDDDFLHPDCLRTMSQAILAAQRRGHDPKIVNCVATNVDEDERPLRRTCTVLADGVALIRREHLLPLMLRDQVPLGTPVQVGHERQAALDVGGWNENRQIQFRNGDESEFWIRLASRGDAILLSAPLAYRTIWSGNENPSHAERREISRYLKHRIVEQMGGDGSAPLPPAMTRYLDLHWGLAAVRDGQIAIGLKLMLGGMFHPSSYNYIWRRVRFADARKLVYVLN